MVGRSQPVPLNRFNFHVFVYVYVPPTLSTLFIRLLALSRSVRLLFILGYFIGIRPHELSLVYVLLTSGK